MRSVALLRKHSRLPCPSLPSSSYYSTGAHLQECDVVLPDGAAPAVLPKPVQRELKGLPDLGQARRAARLVQLRGRGGRLRRRVQPEAEKDVLFSQMRREINAWQVTRMAQQRHRCWAAQAYGSGLHTCGHIHSNPALNAGITPLRFAIQPYTPGCHHTHCR